MIQRRLSRWRVVRPLIASGRDTRLRCLEAAVRTELWVAFRPVAFPESALSVGRMTVRAATNIPASSTITLSGFRVRHTSGEYEDITAANAAVTGQAAPSASIALACSPSILRKVDGSYKGVVIRNGKKVVIK